MPQQSTIDPQTDDSEDGAGVTMTLWTRQPVCGTRTTVLDRLSGLRASGAIEGFDVETWPDEIRLDGETTHGDVVSTFGRFQDWASEHGLSVEPPFEVRQVSPLLGASYRVLRLPVMALATHADDELAGVYPCTDGERTTTIPAFLAAYEATGELPAPGIIPDDAG
jgi:hypothetical protein